MSWKEKVASGRGGEAEGVVGVVGQNLNCLQVRESLLLGGLLDFALGLGYVVQPVLRPPIWYCWYHTFRRERTVTVGDGGAARGKVLLSQPQVTHGDSYCQ